MYYSDTVFLHSYSETTWEDQVTRESLAERTIRATAHARRTLMAGYTTVRYVVPCDAQRLNRASPPTFDVHNE